MSSLNHTHTHGHVPLAMRSIRHRLLSATCLVGAAFATFAAAGEAHAANWNVTNSIDDGFGNLTGSLSWALINSANNDTITIETSTIYANGALTVGNKSLTITSSNNHAVNIINYGAPFSLTGGLLTWSSGVAWNGTTGTAATASTNGGTGGVGIIANGGAEITNFGTIAGGNGGEKDAFGGGHGGTGGVGISASGGTLITNSGTISGGKANGGNGAIDADAIDFSGGGNTLSLATTSVINGNVVSTSGIQNGGDILSLDGTSGSGSIAMSPYQGFAKFAKTGGSIWTITSGGFTGTSSMTAGQLTLSSGVAWNGVTGGNGVSSISDTAGNGGNGGVGFSVSGGTLTSNGTIAGGSGGSGGTGGGFFGPDGGGGNGGAGGVGLSISGGPLTNNGTISGGIGGSGGRNKEDISNVTGGSGGTGGVGINASGANPITNLGTILGGGGGTGGNVDNVGTGGSGGNGGVGVSIGGDVLTNTGAISGGSGGTGGYGINGNLDSTRGTGGTGGVGINASGGARIDNAGTISGGKANAGSGALSDAIDLSGGGNTLSLDTTSVINGNVVSKSGTSNGGDTLSLDGTSGSGSIAMSQYQGFSNFAKTGANVWTVTGGSFTGTSSMTAGQLTLSSGVAWNGVAGGNGVNGNKSGNGAKGGTGISISGGTLTGNGTITGGSGGSGGTATTLSGSGGNGGPGGVGVSISGGTLVNGGTISGGSGGGGGSGGRHGSGGVGGAGGVGISASGGILITNRGTISGGTANAGSGAQADAIDLSGGGNTLSLATTSVINGNVVSNSGIQNGGDTLSLDGNSGGASIAMSQYQGFAKFAKTGGSLWVVTGVGTGNWSITGGTLVGSTDSLAGNLTFAPATGAGTPFVWFSQSKAGTYGARISGAGGVAIFGGGNVTTFTAINSYSGGTAIESGAALNLANDAQAGSGTITVNNNATLSGAGTVANKIVNFGTVVDGGTGITLAGSVSGGGGYQGSTTFSGVLKPGTLQGTITGGDMTFATGGGLFLQGGSLTSYENISAESVTFQSGSTFDFDLNAAAISALQTDLKSVSSVSFDLVDAKHINGYQDFSFATNLANLSGDKVSLFETVIGSRTELGVRVTATPLPGGLTMFGSALAALGFMGWRRQKRQPDRATTKDSPNSKAVAPPSGN